MYLKNINILGYKNIKESSLQLSPGINCFIGSNGEGKTNFLDAVYYLSFCRSATSSVDSTVINHDSDFCVIEGVYENEDGDELDIYTGMKRGVKKRFRRNKKDYKRLSEHIGLIPLIMISPSDISHRGSERRTEALDGRGDIAD